MKIYYVGWIIVILFISCGGSELRCPDVAEFGSEGVLTCNTNNNSLSYISPKVQTIIRCVGASCDPAPDGYTFIRSSNESRLTILDVGWKHEGEWTCDFLNTPHKCKLVISETPSCSIDSDRNPTDLDVNEEITLRVNIANYYCSVPIDFILKTGETTEDLERDFDVQNVTSDIFNSTFNVSDFHIGYLKLLFSCNNVIRTVQCGGVEKLLQKPPSCNISSDKNTGSLDVGEKLSLLVYIEEYRCSRNTKYQLQIGEETMDLNRSKTGVYNETVSFNITKLHFGPLRLNVTCNDISREVKPGGISMLLQRRSTTISSSTTTTPPTTNCKCQCDSGAGTGSSPSITEKYLIVIIAVPIGGIALIIAVILLCCYCVKPRCKSSKISRGYNDSCPYADVADNINSRPVTIRPDAYAEISDINGTFTNQAFDKESTRHQDDSHIILNGRSGDYVQKEAPQSYSTSVSRPDDVYSKVNKRISSTSVSGQC